ncbi:hypothetical protein Tco_0927520 [Tanacetum coccineum]
MPSCCDVLKSLSSPDLELLCYIVMRYPFFANDNLQKVLCLNYGVTTDVSTAYHPQTIYSWTGGGFILMVLKRILERIVEKTKEDSWTQDKNLVFNVGDRVLLVNSRLKIFSGKLKTRWTGPFTVAQVFPYGTVELSQTDGPKFKVIIASGKEQVKPEINVKDTDGVTEIRRPQRLEDLAREDKLRYDSNIKAVNILLLGFPVDIYTLINHY